MNALNSQEILGVVILSGAKDLSYLREDFSLRAIYSEVSVRQSANVGFLASLGMTSF
jgi:hypothetical protein